MGDPPSYFKLSDWYGFTHYNIEQDLLYKFQLLQGANTDFLYPLVTEA